jgi:intracellular septation protein A
LSQQAKIPVHLLILQLFPILVFLVVDGFVDDPSWAIGAALLFVAVQTTTTYVRKKKIDWLILVDALLIGGMGAASLLTDNEWFFKLKPAVIEFVMVPYMAFLAFAPNRILKNYFERFSVGLQINPMAFSFMKKMLLGMTIWVLVHAGLVVYAAFYMSRQNWGLVSGPGFYIILVPLFGWMLLQRQRLKKQIPPPRRSIRPQKNAE